MIFQEFAPSPRPTLPVLNGNFRTADALIAARAGLGSQRLQVIAHRGYKMHAPENTLPAMAMAIARGADAIEMDVQVSADGVLYLMHNTTVDATTEGTGSVAALSSAYLDACLITACIGTPWAGTTVPRFADVLALARRHSIRCYPEIKGYRSQADVALFVSAVSAAGMADMTVLQSYLYSDLAAVRAIDDRIGIGLLGASYLTDYTTAINSVAALGRAMIIWDYTDLIARPAIVSTARAAGVGVACYTVTQSSQVPQIMGLGVDAIMSDIALGWR